MMQRLTSFCGILFITAANVVAADDALQIFDRRIKPILESPKPSSCTECHLSGVDLKDYLRPTAQETYAALVAAQMVDSKDPGKSKLLEFIRREPAKPSLISAKVRMEELAAMTVWLQAAARDPQFQKLPKADKPSGPAIDVEAIRHSRVDHVARAFEESIWSEVRRCAACHSPLLNRKQVEKHGEQISWIVPDTPDATMQKLIDRGLIDVDDPAKSLLLQKPTMQVEHGGGQKMSIGDRSYVQFRQFLENYANILQGRIRRAADVPTQQPERFHATDIWLKLTDIPESLDGQVLQVDLYRVDPDSKTGWSRDRWATSERTVFGKGRLWQHSLSLTAPRDDPAGVARLKADVLPPGKYLVRILIDSNGRLAKEYPARLTVADQVGEVVVDSRWPASYAKMTTVKFPAK